MIRKSKSLLRASCPSENFVLSLFLPQRKEVSRSSGPLGFSSEERVAVQDHEAAHLQPVPPPPICSRTS